MSDLFVLPERGFIDNFGRRILCVGGRAYCGHQPLNGAAARTVGDVSVAWHFVDGWPTLCIAADESGPLALQYDPPGSRPSAVRLAASVGLDPPEPE